MWIWIKRNFDDLLFQSRPAWVLGLTRFLFYSTLLFLFFDYNFARFSDRALPLWEPQILFDIFNLKPLSAESINIIHFLWLFFLAFSAAGLFSRFSTLISFFLGFYLLGLERGYIYSNFQFQQLVIALAALPLSNCGHAFSLDQFIEKKLKQNDSINLYSLREEWIFSLIVFCNCMMFFAAGLSKLRNSGLGWVWNNQLYQYLYLTNTWLIDMAAGWQIQLKTWLMEHSNIVFFLGIFALLLEITSPLAFFQRKLRIPYLIGFLFLLLGVWIFMFIPSLIFLTPLIIFWIPWEKIERCIHPRK